MGVNIDFGKLKQLYAAAQAFNIKIETVIERIQTNINKISNPAFTDGMQGGQGDEAIKAIARGKEALESLLESIRTTREFIDRKLGNAHALTQDKHGFAEKAAKQRALQDEMKIKRN